VLSIGQGNRDADLQMANVMATYHNQGWYYAHFVRRPNGPLPEYKGEAYGERHDPIHFEE
jgi:cell division protein FtsI/penicillin-binding protein 2